MRPLQSAFIVLLCLIVIAMGWAWRTYRSRALIERWAKENGFEVVSAEMRLLWAGPFALRHTRNQTVYRVRVRDRDGVERQGWVRCGSWLMGLLGDAVTVRWD